MKKVLLILLFLPLGIKSFSQIDQKSLIAAINTKLNKVDSVIIERDQKQILLMMDEILSMTENIENRKTRLVAYNVSINKYIEARLFQNAIELGLSTIQKAKDIYEDCSYLNKTLKYHVFLVPLKTEEARVYGEIINVNLDFNKIIEVLKNSDESTTKFDLSLLEK